jgi:HAD superfamily hydrolase (TIGR01509 family)
MPLPVKLCIFDLGGVIIRLKGFATYADMPGYPRNMSQEELWRWFDALPEFPGWETGRTSFDDFARATIAGLDLDIAMDEFKRQAMDMLQDEMPGMDELMERVSARVTTVALSNTNAEHWEKIMRDYPVVKRFNRLFASHLIGLRKPDSEIFRHVLREMKVPAGEAVFIDDTPKHVAAAKSVGIRAHVFENVEQCERVLTEDGVLR